MRTYKKIAEVEFSHNYYPDSICASGDIEIIPMPEMDALLRNYRIILKIRDTKIEFIQEYERDEKGERPFIDIASNLKFQFAVKQKNNDLLSFTNIPFFQLRYQVMVFSNIVKGKIIPEGQLCKDKFVSAKDIQYFIPQNTEQLAVFKNTDFIIVDSFNQTVVKHTTNSDYSKTENSILQLPNGCYIQKAKKQEQPFVLYKSKTNSGIIGWIEIHLNESVYKVVSNNKFFKYQIPFDSRWVYWQYLVFEKYMKLKKINIIDETQQYEFIEDKNGNEKGFAFISKQKIPMRHINNQIFKIVSVNGNENFSKTIHEKLPYPQLNNLVKHKTIKNDFVLNSYIYL